MLSIFSLLFTDWALLALRLAAGIVLLAHGWPKLKNRKQTAEWFGSVGFRPGAFWALVVAIVEFFGAIFVLLGIFVEFVAALYIIQFIVIIIWKLIRKAPLTGEHGLEVDLLMLAAVIALFTFGAGAFSFMSF